MGEAVPWYELRLRRWMRKQEGPGGIGLVGRVERERERESRETETLGMQAERLPSEAR